MKKKHKTYAESQGEKPFDWNKFLAEKKFTKEQLVKADALARDWVTCACGNQCAIIPRHGKEVWSGYGEPLDAYLSEFGVDFSCHVEDMRLNHDIDDREFASVKKKAIRTLAAIEKRSATIIAQILKKQKKAKK